ncbi:hypothetical protein N7470_001009 [Penicillium chermesinum]|nr:hypothetical protein N7470_001009 [Penicillium chermesinum]
MMSDNDPTQDVYSNRDGDWLYHRCQRALEDPKTRPSLYTLQTIIYSIVYLINSSCLDIARRSLANAVQTAYSLGLHHNYPSGSDLQLKNTQKQVWWAIYSLDCLLSFKMGQPCIINMADATIEPPDLPGPVPSEATINGPGEFSRLWYFSQYLKLLSNIRSVSSDILQNCANLMSQSGISSSVHQEPAIRQRCSAYLKESIKPLHRWAREVPSFLRLKRQGDGESFSTTNVPPDFDHYIPIWVQRQHTPRHPLDLPRNWSYIPTTADRNDVHALDHAVASIRIIDQILSEANVLNSWHDAYHYAWDAALTVFAYTLVHPPVPLYVRGAVRNRHSEEYLRQILPAWLPHCGGGFEDHG